MWLNFFKWLSDLQDTEMVDNFFKIKVITMGLLQKIKDVNAAPREKLVYLLNMNRTEALTDWGGGGVIWLL